MDKRRDGRDVPERDTRFYYGVNSSGREEHEAVAVGESARVFCGLIDLIVERAELGGIEIGQRGGVDEGIRELVDTADSRGFGIVLTDFVEASESIGGVHKFVDARHRDGAEHWDTVVEACEHGSKEGDALDE